MTSGKTCNIDKLFEAVAERGPVCVGLDTAPEYVPDALRKKYAGDADAVLAFNKKIIEETAPYAACFKVQIAYYEAMGIAGLNTYAETLRLIRAKGWPVIADIKRGDIADTASRYARAHFSGEFEADFVTLSPYMGMDSLEPWLEYAESSGKGAFVLVRTSNRGMRDFEFLKIALTSGTDDEKKVYHIVGDKLQALAEAHCGVSGYGAQGGAADDAALLLRNGNGGVVNASRSILKAADAAQAAREMRDAIRAALR
jgi:orotidine-5'-phosphate decarboxylase